MSIYGTCAVKPARGHRTTGPTTRKTKMSEPIFNPDELIFNPRTGTRYDHGDVTRAVVRDLVTDDHATVLEWRDTHFDPEDKVQSRGGTLIDQAYPEGVEPVHVFWLTVGKGDGGAGAGLSRMGAEIDRARREHGR